MEKQLEFHLTLERSSDVEPEGATDQSAYVARVTRSPGGTAISPFRLPIPMVEIENFMLRIGHRRGTRRANHSSIVEAQRVGQLLFEAVFGGTTAIAFRRSIDQANRQELPLQIRLRIADQVLATIPWEFLFDPAQDNFLAQSRRTPLARMLDVPISMRTSVVRFPLRVLVMVASPDDYPALDVADEYERLERALAPHVAAGRLEIVRVGGRLLDLQQALQQTPCHIFHFIGHGGFDTSHNAGALVLESRSGGSEHVSGSKLGTLLLDVASLQVAVLNACEGGRPSDDDPFAGVAQSLVRKGIPAVLAMQFDITDDAAISLSDHLYGALSFGWAIDAALAEVRKAMYMAHDGVEWGTPVLYLQSESSQIFRFPDAPEPIRIEHGTPIPSTDPPRRRPSPLVLAVAIVAVLLTFVGLSARQFRSPDEVLGTAPVRSLANLSTEPVVVPTVTPAPSATATPLPSPTAVPTVVPVVMTSNDIFIERVADPPSIDGFDNDWQIESFYRTGGVIYADGWDGMPDAGAVFVFLHDDENLYLLAKVVDDVWDQVFGGERIRNGDGLSLYFASDRSTELDAPRPDDLQLTMAMTKNARPVLHWWAGDGTAFNTALGDRAMVEFAIRESGSDEFKGFEYILEAKIPKAALPLRPSRVLATISDSDGEQARTVVFSHLLDDGDLSAGAVPIFDSPSEWGRLIFN